MLSALPFGSTLTPIPLLPFLSCRVLALALELRVKSLLRRQSRKQEAGSSRTWEFSLCLSFLFRELASSSRGIPLPSTYVLESEALKVEALQPETKIQLEVYRLEEVNLEAYDTRTVRHPGISNSSSISIDATTDDISRAGASVSRAL